VAVLLALLAAVTYGSGDFLGGIASKRTHVLSVVVVSQAIGAALVLATLPFASGTGPVRGAVMWGAAAGVAGGVGVILLYRGLAVGRMAVVAPVTGVVAAIVPLVVGLARGERPSVWAFSGAVIALAAVALVSRGHDEHGAAARSGLPEAFGAGCGFGAFFILLDASGDASGVWPLVGARIASLALCLGIALVLRQSLRPTAGTTPAIVGAGILDVVANLAYLAASRMGLLSMVAVVTSTYPAATIVLARVVLDERLRRVQTVGVACAIVGVALIAVG